jgi:hypothetical protein
MIQSRFYSISQFFILFYELDPLSMVNDPLWVVKELYMGSTKEHLFNKFWRSIFKKQKIDKHLYKKKKKKIVNKKIARANTHK